jgi:hypothetical protein
MRWIGLLAIFSFTACHHDGTPATTCDALTDASRVPGGSATGHPDPAGAWAAHQARAGVITDLSIVKRADDARHPVHVGDFLLANDRISVYLEAARPSDGYTPFGGEILAIETYDQNGQPRGTSEYGESLLAFAGEIVAPDAVTVIADGTDGGPAIVRSSGVLKPLPFLEVFAGLFGDEEPLPAAIDYVLAPGEPRVKIQLHILNSRPAPVDTTGSALLGFFHSYRGQTFSDLTGFGPLDGTTPGFVAWDAGSSAFAFRPRGGTSMKYVLAQAGFELFTGSAGMWPGCQQTDVDYAEIVAGDDLDDLRENLRALDGVAAARAVTVTVKDATGAPLAGAYVHVTADGAYLVRATTAADGTATVHVPGAATLDATATGYEAPPSTTLASDATTAAITMGATGTISVHATEVGSGLDLPVRIQVLPATPPTVAPAAFGVPGEAFGRVQQVLAETGKAMIVVPAGMQRVVVSRGYEYEVSDQTLDVAAGATVSIDAALAHSVDSTGSMCADFHIHSFYSVDAPDPVVDKVKNALAEGLEIPVSSEHEYIIDFQPIIEQLGMTHWAHGLSSDELTTFEYGHFGVVPKNADMTAVNRGAVDWVGKQPAEVFAMVKALPEQPALIVNHPYSASFQGYFTSATFDQATATGDPTLYSDNFDALEVCNNSDVQDNRSGSIGAWFSLLDHGKRVYAVGSSDSHHLRTDPVGYARTCLLLGSDDPTTVTANAVRDAVKNGRGLVTGGLYMTVAGPNGEQMGDTIDNAAGTISFDVVVQAPSWIDADTLEVIVDGQSVQTLTLQPSMVPGPGRRWDAPVDVEVPASLPPGGFHWVVFHASSMQDLAPVTPNRHPFALSNPIFF